MRTAGRLTTVCALLVAHGSGSLILFEGCGSSDASKVSPEEGGATGDAGHGSPSTGGKSSSGGSSAGKGDDLGGSGEGAAAGATTHSAAGEANAAGSTSEGGAGSGEPCVPGTTCSADGVVTVCGDDGKSVKLECTNGCEAGACLQSDLSQGWVIHQFMLSDDSQQELASYSFEQGGLSALQTVNALPSIYYLDRDLESVEVTGKFGVETTSDDDLIGFVFGYQDPEHFYLFDWKQAAQTDGTCGTAEEGAALKLVSSSETLTHCEDFWSSTGNARVSVLVPPSSNPIGWDDNASYDFRLLHQPGHIEIEVRQGSDVIVAIQSSDDTYPTGKFGFYNYSQEQSRYEFFAIQPKLPSAQ